MKKNTLDAAIAELGIEDGDVIKLSCPCGNDFYQYKEGKFISIGSQDLDQVNEKMGEDEIMELITGREFEIIAKGKESRTNKFLHLHNKISCLEDDVVDMKSKIQSIHYDTVFLRRATIEDTAKKDEKKKIAKWVDLGLIAFWGVFLLVAMILAVCGVL